RQRRSRNAAEVADLATDDHHARVVFDRRERGHARAHRRDLEPSDDRRLLLDSDLGSDHPLDQCRDPRLDRGVSLQATAAGDRLVVPDAGSVAHGIVCVANACKDKVKLTFYEGASLPDPNKLFNAELEGNKWRTIDVY